MATNGSDEGEAAEFWEAVYRDRPRVWSGRVNAVLAQEAAALVPGRALDLGCGEGGDALWLAQQGWQVTAVDVSTIALERAAAHAEAAGVGDAIGWECHDLADSFPDGTFDLISAQYLHSTVELPRERVLKRAATAVAPGGAVLIVGHAAFPPWSSHSDADVHFPTPEEVLASLELPDGQWSVVRCETVDREAEGPDGQRGTLTDSIVLARRSGPDVNG